jgi:outer membrane receptor protein involved in Fe transport
MARHIQECSSKGKRVSGAGRRNLNLSVITIVVALLQSPAGFAAPLLTAIPAQSYNIPAGDLGQALTLYAGSAGILLSFDSNLTRGKKTQGLKGNYGLMQGFTELLKNTGLEIVANEDGKYQLRKAPIINSDSQDLPLSMELETVSVRAQRFYEIGPLPGLGLTKDQIPGNVQSITAEEIKNSHSLSLTDLMNRKLQSVTVNDYQGNPFQMDVQYRGFTAGPQIGAPQGLSVFFDGIRVNEPFGDVVNWDMIPMNALASVDVFPGSNPIFGLNTLGGAFTVKTKDGFNHEGFDAEVLSGSFGRKQLQVEGGWNNGTVALFGAGNFFLEDGWRENSPSKVNQLFGKASYRGDKLDLSFSSLIVSTDLTGNGLLPSEMYAQDRNGSFTSEDETKNRLQQFQLSSNYFVNDNFTITGQVYRRNSKRKQVGADVFTDYEADPNRGPWDRRLIPEGEETTCLYKSSNANGLPDYYVLTIDNPDGQSSELFGDPFTFSGVTDPADLDQRIANGEFPNIVKNQLSNATFEKALIEWFNGFKNPNQEFITQRDEFTTPNAGEATTYSDGMGGTFTTPSYFINPLVFYSLGIPDGRVEPLTGLDGVFYTVENNVVKSNYFVLVAPINNAACKASQTGELGSPAYVINDPEDGIPRYIDGAVKGLPGVVEGTPTAVFTNNQIDQIVDGASIQFNWNYEHHKFMVGASIDAASASYSNTRQLGFLDADRNAFLAPDLAHPQFAAADLEIANNNFSGTNTTKSIYFSETWTPTKEWNFTASGRYNETQAKNKIATRFGFGAFELSDVLALPNTWDTCRTDAECAAYQHGYRLPDVSNSLDPAETEKFSYYSFNPSLGATWQATENLNVYGNWAKGTRTPSVIELGCAVGKPSGRQIKDNQNNPILDDDGNPIFIPQGVLDNRECFLPSTLSGDPYLPQIKATTYDIGMRGTFSDLLGVENIQWNLGAYQTDLKDDIYFVSVAGGGGFFDTVGKTRRRGLEAGLSGRQNKWGFGLNYSLTDATFEDDFLMLSADNSSATPIQGFGDGIIRVKSGSTMPGVPLHNLNASVSYDVTPEWTLGFSGVLHSESYLRGNENNEHKVGVTQYRQVLPSAPGAIIDPISGVAVLARQPSNNPGKLPGYATFNFQTSYRFNSEWTATMLVNNVFDKEFFSAGRLGRNPFSPSILGAIGSDGYNHNSNDWLSTNFIAPSAPRGLWISLRYSFDPGR